jgi:hypothetical protein
MFFNLSLTSLTPPDKQKVLNSPKKAGGAREAKFSASHYFLIIL